MKKNKKKFDFQSNKLEALSMLLGIIPFIWAVGATIYDLIYVPPLEIPGPSIATIPHASKTVSIYQKTQAVTVVMINIFVFFNIIGIVCAVISLCKKGKKDKTAIRALVLNSVFPIMTFLVTLNTLVKYFMGKL